MCRNMPTEPSAGSQGVYCSHDWISDLDCFHYLYCYMDYNIVNVGNEREGEGPITPAGTLTRVMV